MKTPFTPEGEKWVLQADGQPYYPEHPSPEVVSVEVIAQSLAQKVRFGGHGWPFYSVAQHSLFVSDLAEGILTPQLDAGLATGFYVWTVIRAALMHDAHEAWLVDLPSPHKKIEWLGDGWRAMEDKWDEVIFNTLGIQATDQVRKAVKTFDLVAMKLEGKHMMPEPPGEWDWPGHGANSEHIIELAEQWEPYFEGKYLRTNDIEHWRNEFLGRWRSLSDRPGGA